MSEEKLVNVLLSTNPCPKCWAAAQSGPLTMGEWQKSRWGLPGSGLRYCKAHCHCALVPVAFLPELPNIAKRVSEAAKQEIELRPIVDIYPNELVLKDLMNEYNATLGKLPEEIYIMPIKYVIPYLKKLLGKTAG